MSAGAKTGGRQKGTPNKTTTDVRSAVALLAENNIDRLEGWLDEIAETDPVKASDLFLRILEYHVPKLARTTMEGHLDLNLPNAITVRVIRPDGT